MAETVEETRLRLEQFVLETNPDADVAPGTVLNELILKLSATMQNPIHNDMLDLGQANSINKALNSTTDTQDPIIDEIASNYNTVRNEGSKSVGKIRVTVTGNNTYYIRAGFVFNQPVVNLNYVVTQAYTVTANADDDEIPLVRSGNLFYFIIPVEAENGGAEYQMTDQTSFNVVDNSIKDFVEAKAYGNFTTGDAIETDKELLARIDTSLANKTLLSPSSIASRLRGQYTNFKDISLVGANDAEMTRSKQNVFGISTLGMVDAYLRTSNGVETVTITKVAEKDADDGLWHANLDYNDVPGFYRVISVVPAGEQLSGSLLLTQTFDFSTNNLDVINNITNLYEARFSKYQTCSLSFEYSHPSNLTSAEFDLLISYQPNIGEIQDLFLNSDERIACADYLIKAALPCYVTINLKVHRRNSSTEIPVDKIKQDIYNYVNSIKFGEDLYASEIVDICHNYDIKYVELPIGLVGEIYTNHSTILTISDNDVLTIPSKPSLGVSKKTTVFITDYFKSADDNRLSDAIGIEVL